jgi:hypothetical protein
VLWLQLLAVAVAEAVAIILRQVRHLNDVEKRFSIRRTYSYFVKGKILRWLTRLVNCRFLFIRMEVNASKDKKYSPFADYGDHSGSFDRLFTGLQ